MKSTGATGKEVLYQVAETLVGNNVLLAAGMAEPAMHKCSAVQAIFLFTFRLVRQVKFSLKIRTIHSIEGAALSCFGGNCYI